MQINFETLHTPRKKGINRLLSLVLLVAMLFSVALPAMSVSAEPTLEEEIILDEDPVEEDPVEEDPVEEDPMAEDPVEEDDDPDMKTNLDLGWMRSTELMDESLKIAVGGENAWTYNQVFNSTPIKYFENTDVQDRANEKAAEGTENATPVDEQLVGLRNIWDRGNYFDVYKEQNGNVSYDWASWKHWGVSGSTDYMGEYSMRRFAAYFEMSENDLANISEAFLAPQDELGNKSYLFPINDNVFVFVNGQLAYWGGTDVIAGENQHGALNRTTFMGKTGIKVRSGVNGIFKDIYPHTDGWCIDLEDNKDDVNIKPLLNPGFNRIDVITDDYWEGGGMNRVKLFFDKEMPDEPEETHATLTYVFNNHVHKLYNGPVYLKDSSESYGSVVGSSNTVKQLNDVFPGYSGTSESCVFLGWSRDLGGTVEYRPGDSVQMTSDTTLYGIWRSCSTGIDDIFEGTDQISGMGAEPIAGAPGSTIEICLPNGNVITTASRNSGLWSIPVPDGDRANLIAGSDVRVIQIEAGKQPSIPMLVTIWGDGYSEVIDHLVKAFNVSYDANGGTGEFIDSGIVSGNYRVMNLSETGIEYTDEEGAWLLSGWNTMPDGSGISYNEGQSINLTGGIMLYAQWYRDYKVTYHPNKGFGDIFSQPANGGQPYRICIPEEVNISGKTAFLSWNTRPNGSGMTYYPGEQMDIYEDLDLYAQWKEAVMIN